MSNWTFQLSMHRQFKAMPPVEADQKTDNMDVLFQTIIDNVPPPPVELDAPFQMQISQLDYSSYLGVIGIGRVKRGSVTLNKPVTVIDDQGKTRNGPSR